MPHDRNGKEIKFGDFVYVHEDDHNEGPGYIVGRVTNVTLHSDTCNARVVWPSMGRLGEAYVTASKCIKVEPPGTADPESGDA